MTDLTFLVWCVVIVVRRLFRPEPPLDYAVLIGLYDRGIYWRFHVRNG
jgi:hypothetical protein